MHIHFRSSMHLLLHQSSASLHGACTMLASNGNHSAYLLLIMTYLPSLRTQFRPPSHSGNMKLCTETACIEVAPRNNDSNGDGT